MESFTCGMMIAVHVVAPANGMHTTDPSTQSERFWAQWAHVRSCGVFSTTHTLPLTAIQHDLESLCFSISASDG
jgi:hypothetical protein